MQLDGGIKEEGAIAETDAAQSEKKYYDSPVDFVQVVNLAQKVRTYLAGTITYTPGNDKEMLSAKTHSFALQLK